MSPTSTRWTPPPKVPDAEAVNVLFLDMNAFFASAEQQLRPELRGRPVAVAALDVESTSCIAVSYEARPYGIRTGTPVWEAKKLCRDLVVLPARPREYVALHHAIRAAAESCLPIDKVESIDEMHGRLAGNDRRPEEAAKLGHRLKSIIRRDVGNHLSCSVGIAPNRLLAKIASDLMKPNGLTVIRPGDLPHRLHPLKLTDLPGIAKRMEARINKAGIFTVEQLCAASEKHLHDAWGSVVGRMWWYRLRGLEWHEPPTRRRSLGHSHVLAPKFRTPDGARAVLVRLIHKAAARLRDEKLWASRMHLYVSTSWKEQGWGVDLYLGQTQSTLAMVRAMVKVWPTRPPGVPTQVAVTLHELASTVGGQLDLFTEVGPRDAEFDALMDGVNGLFGTDYLHSGEMCGARDTAPVRISFGRIPGFKPACAG